jgi:hypothetical protein
MKVKVMNSFKKIAAIATGALFLGATMGMAAVFGSGLSGLGTGSLGYITNAGVVNAVVVVSANGQAQDILGAIDIAGALTAKAASLHSGTAGYVTVGTLALSSTSLATQSASVNNTKFTWSPLSANLNNKINFTINPKIANYTMVENVTFSSTSGNKAYLNGLNVVFPTSAFELQSYIWNLTSKALVTLNNSVTAGLHYLIGTNSYTLLSYTTKNYTVGAASAFTSTKVPQTLTVGTTTIGLEGLATVGSTPASLYYQLEFNVNGGATNYVNTTGTGTSATVSGVTLKVTNGKIITNTSGQYLGSLQISSSSVVQNWSSANLFGLGNYNTTAVSVGGDYLNFANSKTITLTYSFGTASNFALPLLQLSLEPLTHVYASPAQNITIATATAQTDVLIPNSTLTATTAQFYYTHGLSNVAFGTDFRGNLPASGSTPWNAGGPDGTLQPLQWFTNTSNFANITARSEYVFPYTVNGGKNYWSNVSAATVFKYAIANGSNSVRVLYQLPNGKKFGLVFGTKITNISSTPYVPYIVDLLENYTSTGSFSIISSPAAGTYKMGGFNLTIAAYKVPTSNVTVDKYTVSGPLATVTPASESAYNVVPGYTGLYATNGTLLTSPTLTNNLGSLSYANNILTYTDPVGGTQSVTIMEDTGNFTTNISTPTNTTANTWGDKVIYASGHGAKIEIPVQNYTLALGGSQVIGSKTNYTVGQTAATGEVLSIGGASAVTAPSLFGAGVFPLAELDSQFVSSTNSVPVIVVGGPAVNTVAQSLLGLTGPIYGSAFTTLTGVGSGEALVQLFTKSAAVGGQNAMLIAGWNPSDTLNAAEVVSEYLLGTPVVNLNGTKMILSTSASSYKGVTIVSQS